MEKKLNQLTSKIERSSKEMLLVIVEEALAELAKVKTEEQLKEWKKKHLKESQLKQSMDAIRAAYDMQKQILVLNKAEQA